MMVTATAREDMTVSACHFTVTMLMLVLISGCYFIELRRLSGRWSSICSTMS